MLFLFNSFIISFEIRSKIFNNNLIINENHILIHFCFFTNISQSSIQVENSFSNINIYNSNFYYCLSNSNGGAINIISSNSFNHSNVCFFLCNCINHGTAIYSHSNKINSSFISCLKCPDFTQISWEPSIFYISNEIFTSYSNSSSCSSTYTAGFTIFNSLITLFKFIHSNNHKSGCSIFFYSINSNSIINNLIFNNNSNSLGIIRLYNTDIILKNSIFFNNSNILTYYLTSQIGYISFYECHFDSINNILGLGFKTSSLCYFPPNNIKNYLIFLNKFNCISSETKKIYQKNSFYIFFKLFLLFC